MPLPDVSRLLSLSPASCAALGARLRAIGLDARYVASAMRVGERLDDALRAPMRTWSLRRRREPAAYAMRALVLGDAVDLDDARAALGDLGALLDAGLLVAGEGGVASPFRLDIAFDRFFLADDLRAGAEAVMGPSATTAHLCRAARPLRPVASLLDVGCGAGTVAIVLADRAVRVVATDINARALSLTEVNARMNGVNNVELRQGDLFAPAKGEEFARVVSQPPFVARAKGEGAAPFLFGGARGDEIALRLLAQIGSSMAPGGRAFVLVDWPAVEGDPIEDRVRRAIPEVDMNALLVQSPARNLEDHCTLHAAAAHVALDEGFSRAAIGMRDHLEAMKVQSLKLTLNVLERAPAPPGWTATLATRHFVDAPPTAEAIDHALAARACVAGGRDALLGARVRVVDRAVFEERAIEPGMAPVVLVRLPDERMVPPVILDARVAATVLRVSDAPSVRAVAEGAPDAALVLADVADALLHGVLEVVSIPRME